jgi:hypothetical protein
MGMLPSRSIFDDARDEALREKWIRSYHARRDMGIEAILDWATAHWARFLRAKWCDHIRGHVRYQEFTPQSYGALQREYSSPLLVDRIMDRLAEGHENLDIFQWAHQHGLAMGPVFEILEAVDVNSCRLRFELSRCA